MKWLNDFLKDRDKIRNTISAVIIGVPFVVLFFYWGVLENIQITRDFDFKTLGFISLVFVLAGDQVKVDWRRRSKQDFEQTDIEHKSTMDLLDAIEFIDEDYSQGKAYVDKLNDKTRHQYNVKYTDKQIAKLDRQINKMIRKGKSVDEVESVRRIKRELKENPISPNWWNFRYKFTEFDYYEISSSYDDMGEINTIEDGSSIKVNIINRNRGLSLVFGVIRSTVTATAGLYILFTVPLLQMFIILGLLAISLLVIALFSYSMNTAYMLKKVKPATERKLYRKQEMRKHVDSVKTHENTLVSDSNDKKVLEVANCLESVRKEIIE